MAEVSLPQGVTLNERQQRALKYVHEHGSISVAIYQREYNVSERQARRDLADMVKHGDLRVVGKGQATSYVLHEMMLMLNEYPAISGHIRPYPAISGHIRPFHPAMAR